MTPRSWRAIASASTTGAGQTTANVQWSYPIPKITGHGTYHAVPTG